MFLNPFLAQQVILPIPHQGPELLPQSKPEPRLCDQQPTDWSETDLNMVFIVIIPLPPICIWSLDAAPYLLARASVCVQHPPPLSLPPPLLHQHRGDGERPEPDQNL